MRRSATLATIGRSPAFPKPLRCGQSNLPDWQRFESAFRGIFERRFFANGGPLVRQLDAGFARLLGVNNSVSVTNESVALMILLKALEIDGEVIIPALSPPDVPQAVWWAGLSSVVCDVDPETLMLSPETIAPKLSSTTVAILGVRVFGQGDGSEELEGFASDNRLKLVFDASSAIKCARRGRNIGGFGAGEAFSFHSSQLINAAEGGSIVTNDEVLASKLRTMRNFYLPAEPVTLRINGKMAEASAALALLCIEDVPRIINENKRRYNRYRIGLQSLRGISLFGFEDPDANNYQSVVLRANAAQLGITAHDLMRTLAGENVFCERPFGDGIHRLRNAGLPAHASRSDFPVADALCKELLQLPSGQAIQLADIDQICALIRGICASARPLGEVVSPGD